MSAKTETIRVGIFPRIRVVNALLVTAALVASLLLGMILGRTSDVPAQGASQAIAPRGYIGPPLDPTVRARAGHWAGVENTPATRDLTPYMCTGHVPNPACEMKVARGYGVTAHVPPGGPEVYGE